jgi:putative endonuclease
MFKEYHVYILTNKPCGVLYVGISGNLTDRIKTHKALSVKGFTQRYKLTKLVYFETFADPNEAIAREKELRHWMRDWKISLIEKSNPDWVDLAHDW